MADALSARCSWCLASTTHRLKEKARMGRDVYLCTGCNKRTLQCKSCVARSSSTQGSFKRRSGGSSLLKLSVSSSGDEDAAERGMARDGMLGDDCCLVCDQILGAWPSPMDGDPVYLERTGSASPRSPGSDRMRSTTTLSHTQSRAPAPTAKRQDIRAGEIRQLQLALLDAQRSVLVRVDNRTPHSVYLIDGTAQIEYEFAAGGEWCLGKEPPLVIAPNQAVAFGTVSKGMGLGGTSARVGYEFRDKATQQRVATVQLRWVNPLLKGDKRNWCEVLTNFSSELGPRVSRLVQGANDHSTVSFEILWGEGGPEHFNPDVTSNREGMLRPLQVQDSIAVGARGSYCELHSQNTAVQQLPEISVWENQRRPPLVGDFTPILLIAGVDPSQWSDGNSDGSYQGLDDPTLLPSDCVWYEGAGWQPQNWEYAVSFATSFPRNLYSSFSSKKGLTDMVRRREWRRPCIPQGSTKHGELQAALQTRLMGASERTMLVTIHNRTHFPMVLESVKVTWGLCVPGGHPRSLIPPSTSATIGLRATTPMTGVEGSLQYSVKPTESSPGTTVFLRYVNPKVQSELGVWCETKTMGEDGAPRLGIKRINPTQSEHSECTFTVEENPAQLSPNTHYNPAKGLDAGEGMASPTVDGMSSAAVAGNDGLRMFLKQSTRSTLVTLTNLSSRKLMLTRAEVKGGSWAGRREPPHVIDPNSVVSFGASCSAMSISKLKVRVMYHSEVSQGEWQGIWFDQQAGFSIRCKNPSSRLLGSKECTFTKYLLGDDTMGLKVAKQDSIVEQGDNNEWNFLITDGEDPYTIYASRKQDLTSRLSDEERSMIVSIANRCRVPLVLGGHDVSAGQWEEPPPTLINPGQTAMMALKPHILELAGIQATLKYLLADSTALEILNSRESSASNLQRTASDLGGVRIEFSNSAGRKNSYRSVSNGSVFCERLVDPHDVDQLMEADTHASATFVVEQASVEFVNIGTSAENTKTISVEGVLGAESVPINMDAQGKPDLFDVRVEQSTGRIVVRRVDAAGGWDHDLRIRARVDPAIQEAEGDGADPRPQTHEAGTVSGFVRIGYTDWMRRGMLFTKERETETNVEYLKDELSLDKDLHTDMALQASCQRLGVLYQPGASSLKLSRDCTQAILREVKAQQRCGIFMSHAQINGGPQVRALKPRLQEDCAALQGTWEDLPDGKNEKIWLDVDEKPDPAGMKDGIRRQSCFLIFLTKGYLTRRFCQFEITWALRYEKTIVLVYETNTEYGHPSFGDYIAECPVDLRVIFEKSVAVPYYSDDVFGPLSRAEILAQCGLSPTRPTAGMAPRTAPTAPAGPVVIVANDNDSTARAQAENLKQQLLKASPELKLKVFDDRDYRSTQSQQPESFLVFLTNHVFQQPAVCGVLRAAARSSVNVVFVAEADMRYHAVGIPLMGGMIAQELRDQVPDRYRQELKQLLDQARPIPFYPVRLFRDESIAQVLAALCQEPAPRDSSDALTSDDVETRADVLALIHRLEQEKEAALAEKDADMQQVVAAHAKQIHSKEMELVALRDEIEVLREQLRRRAITEPGLEPQPEPETAVIEEGVPPSLTRC